MATRRITITIPPNTLKRVDRWAERLKKSCSWFIVEQVEKRLQEIEDQEVTRLYDQAYKDKQALEENRELAEEMLPNFCAKFGGYKT